MSRGLTMKEAYFQPHYSGSASLTFWKEVRHKANDRTLYDFACALQDIEGRVLAALNSGVRIRARKTALITRHRRAVRHD